MTKPGSRISVDESLAILERCAVAGERCPITSGPDAHPLLLSAHFGKLAREGRIFVEISGHNWRRVTILTGPNKGKSTAPNPDPLRRRAWQTVGVEGAKVNGKLTDHGAASRRQPSLPRFLIAEELK